MNSKHRARRIPSHRPGGLPGWASLALGVWSMQAVVVQAQVPVQPVAAKAAPTVSAPAARQAPLYDVTRLGLGASLPIAPGKSVATAAGASGTPAVGAGVALSAASARQPAVVAPSVASSPVPTLTAAAAIAAPSVAAALLAAAPDPGASAPPAHATIGPDLQAQIRQMVASGTQGIVKPGSGITRVDVELGVLDPRLHLAPCARVEPYLPNGMRLAGRSRIGLRCLEGTTRWNVYMPITVRIFGPALVAARTLQAGAVLAEGDLSTAEIDLADEPSPAMTQLPTVVGRILARPMTSGQGLRQATLKSRLWFAVGDTVSIAAVGEGFAVAGEGQAMTPGIEGQPAKVKTESGRIVTGMPVSSRRLEVQL
ncbi:MAG: flagellar basal body P-ring formation chaperone FlgA [Janthinobacterium lividum]